MKIQYGVGRRCVNPQVPVSLAGYFNKRMWDHVLDDLEVRALVMKSGSTYAAIIHFDLITVSTALYENILADIRELGIDSGMGAATAAKAENDTELAERLRETVDERSAPTEAGYIETIGVGLYTAEDGMYYMYFVGHVPD